MLAEWGGFANRRSRPDSGVPPRGMGTAAVLRWVAALEFRGGAGMPIRGDPVAGLVGGVGWLIGWRASAAPMSRVPILGKE